MNGIDRIAKERKRQIEEEGWTAEHDEQHEHGELARVAALYAIEASAHLEPQAGGAVWQWLWPKEWAQSYWRPGAHACQYEDKPISDVDALRCLEKAGALIAAEIDRRLRAKEPK